MKDLQSFTKEYRCPKCLGLSRKIEFAWQSDGVEYLKVTCGSCGYTWNMETADAGKKQVILEELVKPNPQAKKAMDELGVGAKEDDETKEVPLGREQ